MITVDFSDIELSKIITHHVGNKTREENFQLSDTESFIENETDVYLLKYFLQSFKTEEFYCFTHAVELVMNDVYNLIHSMFANYNDFVELSKTIPKLLYEYSTHPKVKEGELNIVYFTNAVIDDDTVDCIGIFKSETDVPFLKMKNRNSKFEINHEFGFELKGIDKACIIFNISAEEGYRMLIIDSKSSDAQYWKNDFLQVKPISDEFHQTNQFLSIAKNFVTKQIPEEFEVSKTDQIDLLNRSVDYFKKHEKFDKQEFETEVFHHPNIIESFKTFDENYCQKNEIELNDSFDISPQAVKKQAKAFKSILKLDKNFHIYIHGSKELIEHGVENDGRKYYKIYYEKEE